MINSSYLFELFFLPLFWRKTMAATKLLKAAVLSTTLALSPMMAQSAFAQAQPAAAAGAAGTAGGTAAGAAGATAATAAAAGGLTTAAIVGGVVVVGAGIAVAVSGSGSGSTTTNGQ
jgi:hypothetical protein